MPRIVLLGLTCSILVACVPQAFDDPLAKMLDRHADAAHRQAAAVQARRELADDPKRIAVLNELVWHVGHPAALRIEAVDQLIEYDPNAFCDSVSKHITRVQDWQVLEHIFDQVVARQWRQLTPALVRHYALKAHAYDDAQRPERRAIAQLNLGKSVEQVVFEVFAQADGSMPVTVRVAAWHLLSRLHARASLRQLLEQAQGRTPLVIDLQAASADWHVLPTNREGILWLSYLRAPSRREYWETAKAQIAGLSPAQQQGLELRHIGPIMHADRHTLFASRATLAAQLKESLTDSGTHHETAYSAAIDKAAPGFETAIEQLSWPDLVTLEMIRRAVHTPAVTSVLFEQADADLADTTTEHGGVLDRGDQGLRAVGYLPALRRHDRHFIPPNEMVRHLYTAALGHYHFHVQSYKNSAYAGPGGGDLKTAEALPFNFIVFTFIDRDQLNIDYYQLGRLVIDLGTIKRRTR